MVVGRALNGWENTEVIRGDADDGFEALIERCMRSFVGTTEYCPLAWVEKRWGKGRKGEYRTSRSAFWRMARRLVKHYGHSDEGWSGHLCWNNLMRVSPACGGNPPKWSYDAQLPYAARLLAAEVVALKPSALVVFAGHDWFAPFAEALESQVKLLPTPDLRYVTGHGRFADSNLVVAPHPMKKKEDVLIGEIATYLAARPDSAR